MTVRLAPDGDNLLMTRVWARMSGDGIRTCDPRVMRLPDADRARDLTKKKRDS
jgi:hypothetical protein